MTQYLLSVIEPDGPVPEPEVMARIDRDVTAVDSDMRTSGVWVFSNGLLPPSSATVLRPGDGEVLVTDGPFAEGKEHLGGFSIVDVPDLDAALEWGRRLALATTLPIEVRPFRG
ncbi:YciI family protein [Leifsonia virtsii]|uniref:YciI family protein n=1 Tax=Leifsonia virtsii TaxID=3035915 RepID=A0ABT8IV88_9MICO|nr:YciI family protein [Leifsonia virtsii]MDN4596593.1 YciI family protein [Leifsonia virtsii]